MSASKEELLIYIKKIRLEESKRINDDKINRNAHVVEEKTTFKGFLKNTGHAFVRAVTDYDEQRIAIDKQLTKFDEKYPSVISLEDAKDTINDLFSNDDLDLISLLFATSVIFDNEFKYHYGKETLGVVSKLLYGKPDELITLQAQIEDIYSKIFGTSLNENQLGALGLTVFGVLVGVIGLMGGTPLLSMSSAVLVGGAIIGSVYGGMKLYNYGKGACDIRKLSPGENALNLSIQLLFIMRLHEKLSRESFKEKLDEILKANANLKSDVDYYLFVEQEDRTNNDAKLKQFHKFEDLLSKYLLEGSIN